MQNGKAQNKGAGKPPADRSRNNHSNNGMVPRYRLNQEIEKNRQLKEDLDNALQAGANSGAGKKVEEQLRKENAALRRKISDFTTKPIEDKIFEEYGVVSPNVLKKHLAELSSNLSPEEFEKKRRAELDTLKEQEDFKVLFSEQPAGTQAKTIQNESKPPQVGAPGFKGMSKVPNGGRETGQTPSLGAQLAQKHNQRNGSPSTKTTQKQE